MFWSQLAAKYSRHFRDSLVRHTAALKGSINEREKGEWILHDN